MLKTVNRWFILNHSKLQKPIFPFAVFWIK